MITLNGTKVQQPYYMGAQLNAVYFDGVLVWGSGNFATTKLKRVGFNTIYGLNVVNIENTELPYNANLITVNGFNIYVTPQPVYTHTDANFENVKTVPTNFYIAPIVSKIYLNENASNTFRNVFSGSNSNSAWLFNKIDFSFAQNMSRTFDNCTKMQSAENKNISDTTTNLYMGFYNCQSLQGHIGLGNNIVNMCRSFTNCTSMTGNFECSNATTDMSYAYMGCTNLKGKFVIKNNVVNLAYAFASTNAMVNDIEHITPEDYNVIPEIPASVKSMSHAFQDAFAGDIAYCGRGVEDMSYAYANAMYGGMHTVAGDWRSVSNLDYCFDGSLIFYGDLWLNYTPTTQSSPTVSAVNMLRGRIAGTTQSALNIHVAPDSYWNTWFHAYPNAVTGNIMTWTSNVYRKCYYNTYYNIYVFYGESNINGGIDLKSFTINGTRYDNRVKYLVADKNNDAEIII